MFHIQALPAGWMNEKPTYIFAMLYSIFTSDIENFTGVFYNDRAHLQALDTSAKAFAQMILDSLLIGLHCRRPPQRLWHRLRFMNQILLRWFSPYTQVAQNLCSPRSRVGNSRFSEEFDLAPHPALDKSSSTSSAFFAPFGTCGIGMGWLTTHATPRRSPRLCHSHAKELHRWMPRPFWLVSVVDREHPLHRHRPTSTPQSRQSRWLIKTLHGASFCYSSSYVFRGK